MHCKIEKQSDNMQQKQSQKFTEIEGYFLKVQFLSHTHRARM